MKNTGDGRRVQRAEKEVQQVIAKYLISGFRFPLPGLVTVTRTQMSADLRSAKVYISLLNPGGDEDKALAETVELLQDNASEIQFQLGKQLASRYTPRLTFYADHSVEKVMKVDRLLREIDQSRKK